MISFVASSNRDAMFFKSKTAAICLSFFETADESFEEVVIVVMFAVVVVMFAGVLCADKSGLLMFIVE